MACKRMKEEMLHCFFHLPPSTVVLLNRINVSMSTWAPQMGCHSQEHPSFGLAMPKMAMETPKTASAMVAFLLLFFVPILKTDPTTSGAVPCEDFSNHGNPALRNLNGAV